MISDQGLILVPPFLESIRMTMKDKYIIETDDPSIIEEDFDKDNEYCLKILNNKLDKMISSVKEVELKNIPTSNKVKVISEGFWDLEIGTELVFNCSNNLFEYDSEDEETTDDYKSYSCNKLSFSIDYVKHCVDKELLQYIFEETLPENNPAKVPENNPTKECIDTEFYISPRVYKGKWNGEVYVLTDIKGENVYVSKFGFNQLFKKIE